MVTIKELSALLRELKSDICDDYRVSDDPDDTLPGICVTVGTNDRGDSWSYQTGDNSFTGGAYAYPHWAVIYLYRRSNCTDLAREAIAELREAMPER